MRGTIRAFGGLVLAVLAGCGGEPPTLAEPQVALLPTPTKPLQCVPYAREVSGIDLRGDAWTWWGQAEGRYSRGKAPRPGAVLVFTKTHKLPLGHLSVVTRVLQPREILVSHANWGASPATRGRVTKEVRVIDVSPGNDWSELRVWNGNSFGRTYSAKGFIYPIAATTGA